MTRGLPFRLSKTLLLPVPRNLAVRTFPILTGTLFGAVLFLTGHLLRLSAVIRTIQIFTGRLFRNFVIRTIRISPGYRFRTRVFRTLSIVGTTFQTVVSSNRHFLKNKYMVIAARLAWLSISRILFLLSLLLEHFHRMLVLAVTVGILVSTWLLFTSVFCFWST